MSYCWRTYIITYKAEIFARVAPSLCAFSRLGFLPPMVTVRRRGNPPPDRNRAGQETQRSQKVVTNFLKTSNLNNCHQ
jgi:hypothetical protein